MLNRNIGSAVSSAFVKKYVNENDSSFRKVYEYTGFYNSKPIIVNIVHSNSIIVPLKSSSRFTAIFQNVYHKIACEDF